MCGYMYVTLLLIKLAMTLNHVLAMQLAHDQTV